VTLSDVWTVENSCVPGTAALDDVTCDGMDDDCDGLVDEDYVVDGSCGVGACQTNNTPSSCVSGIETACVPGTAALDDATCDGIDDDCDGQVDEEFGSTPTSCGEGACASAGALSCVNERLTLLPSADARVASNNPDENFGLDMTLWTDTVPEARSYFRFDVTGIGSESIGQVVLRLTTRPEPGAASISGGDLHAITPSGWEEGTVTFATSPVVDGPFLASVGPNGVGEVVDLDVTGAVTGDGTYEFALVGVTGDGALYFSRGSREMERSISRARRARLDRSSL
jgi:hypothetical protein